jgi:hypothetical protein
MDDPADGPQQKQSAPLPCSRWWKWLTASLVPQGAFGTTEASAPVSVPGIDCSINALFEQIKKAEP